MAHYQASYEFDYGPDRIYAILSEVELMSEFMPLCKRSRVVHRERDPDGAEVVTANFLLRYRRINYEQSLDLRFTFWPSERRMKVEEPQQTAGAGYSMLKVSGSGPRSCRVQFESDFRPKSLMLRWLMPKRLVIEAVNRVMDRVRQRAKELEQFDRTFRSGA